MFSKFTRGMVYWCDLPKYEQNPNVQAGMRPAIIVSNNVGNVFSRNVTIVPCTTNLEKKAEQPTHVRLNLNNQDDSIVLCEMVLTVSKDLMKTFMGMLDETTMKEIDAALAVALNLVDVKFPEKKEKTTEEKLEEKTKRNRGRKVSGYSEMQKFLSYASTHSREETAAEYGIPTVSAVAQRINYYKKKLKTEVKDATN